MPPNSTVKPASTAAEICGATNLYSEAPAAPSATWFKWNAGQISAHGSVVSRASR